MFKIESNVPVPRREPVNKMYPFDDLLVGQSFFVPKKTTNGFGGVVSAATKRTGHKYVTRSVDGGVRVWRFE